MRGLRGLALALASPALGGCLTTHLEPKELSLDEPPPAVGASGSVSVVAGPAAPGLFTIELAGQKVTLDRVELTEALVERVEALLRDQGASIAQDGTKTLELEVVYTNILPGGRNHCVVDVTVRTGNGYARGHQARETSADPTKACRAALSRAAYEILLDREVRDYLAST